ncbi:putative chitinase 1-like [Capsicum annuum]|uniref:Uncharacterized protein n=1 Tax=Capsicum annuum TaxID=4072 RepID=A0A1U8ENB7_CAPAN|nr:kinesin-like protein KIF27 [Capsicum annuum]KAF3613503.1 putative chitinase 1-like [Capsicum annuum]KAF3666674.1 putative chitinase 1-like [Capsicum annuum]PHT68848.1 hypothetical protein T459_28335 [Capsicum annuum]
MKIVSSKVKSTTPTSLAHAAKSLSKFAASNHEASHAVSLYLQRAADSFNNLVKVHEKLSREKKHSANDIKVDEVSESKQMDLKVEDVVTNEENKKNANLGKEENPETDTRNKMKKSSKNDKVGEGEPVKSKKNELEFVKIEHSEEISESRRDHKKNREVGLANEGVMKNVDIPNGSRESKKSKNLGKENEAKKLIKTEKQLDIYQGETVKSNVKTDSSAKMELELKEVKEDGVTSKDKKKRKKKNRGVGDSEQEVKKVEEDLGNKTEEEGQKRKSMDPDACENAGSTEQSSKKKSKNRRVEGEK